MKNITVRLLSILIIICFILSGCQVYEMAVDRISYSWIITDIHNNTDKAAQISLGGIIFLFDETEDVRTLDRCCYPANVYFPILTSDNEAKFVKDFTQLAANGELYKKYPVYTVNAPQWYAECLYGKDINKKNPLDLYDYTCDTYNITLPPHSAKKIYYRFFTVSSLGGDSYRLKSVKMDITFPTAKMTLLGWDEDFWHYDVSDDTAVLYCHDVWYDADNPSKTVQNHQPIFSESLRCYYCEETVAINGDTTSDIVVTQNCVNAD